MKSKTTSTSLTDLPNIGTEVAHLLEMAGIHSPDDLRRFGAVAAALRIHDIRPQDPPCRCMISGLEGAIRGVRWHSIPKTERDFLWEQYATQLAPPEQ